MGIGGDFDGCSTAGLTFCLNNVSYYPRLTAELVRRGWTKEELRGLFGQNILRVLRANEVKATELQAAVRALHFPLSHSFPHTNLKSPCAEQGARANGTTILHADGPTSTTEPSL